MSCYLPVSFIHHRHDKFTTLKFQLIPDAWIWIWWLFLFSEAMNLPTRIFLLSLLIMWRFLSPIFEILNGSLVKFVNWDLSVLFLRSQTSPHVMYSSAVWFLGLSRGIGSHIYYIGAPQYTMLIFGFPSLHTLRQYIRQRCNYCVQCIYLFITTI